MSRSAAGDDLRKLVSHGVLMIRGRGPGTRYVFPSAMTTRKRSSRPGRPTKWTDAVIEAELRTFLHGKSAWPSPREFRAAGRGPLYAAATKAGGVSRWRRIVGL